MLPRLVFAGNCLNILIITFFSPLFCLFKNCSYICTILLLNCILILSYKVLSFNIHNKIFWQTHQNKKTQICFLWIFYTLAICIFSEFAVSRQINFAKQNENKEQFLSGLPSASLSLSRNNGRSFHHGRFHSPYPLNGFQRL